MSTKRNPFFLPSGFEPQEIINIIEAKGENKKRLDKIKERKRAEKRRIKMVTYKTEVCNKCKQLKIDQIQRGFDLATKWGWDGINRLYTPKIMSVFGGNKRKKG